MASSSLRFVNPPMCLFIACVSIAISRVLLALFLTSLETVISVSVWSILLMLVNLFLAWFWFHLRPFCFVLVVVYVVAFAHNSFPYGQLLILLLVSRRNDKLEEET